jgi:DNA-binding transcriptional regulator YdaS (Cro superfamily)
MPLDLWHMKKTTAVKLFGTQYRLAKALGISQAAVSHWDELVPELSARRICDLKGIEFDARPYQRKRA